MIKFEVLAMKADIDKLYAIFLLKKKHKIVYHSRQYWGTYL